MGTHEQNEEAAAPASYPMSFEHGLQQFTAALTSLQASVYPDKRQTTSIDKGLLHQLAALLVYHRALLERAYEDAHAAGKVTQAAYTLQAFQTLDRTVLGMMEELARIDRL